MSDKVLNLCHLVAEHLLAGEGAGKEKTEFLSFEEVKSRFQGEKSNPLYVALITGPSGVGKSWLATQLSAHLDGFKKLSLDDFSTVTNKTEFEIDLDKLVASMVRKPTILEGLGSNLESLKSFIQLSHVYYVIPSFDVFITSNTRKLAEGKERKLKQSSLDHWESASKMTEKSFISHILRTIRLTRKHLSGIPFSVICLHRQGALPVEGWHKVTKGGRNA